MKNDRLFQMMNLLIEKEFVTAKELADRFQVSIRTIYRDIEILSVSGVPLYTIQGKGGGIALMDGYSVDKTLLSDSEQKQVLMALESVQAITGKKDDTSLEKLKNVFHKDVKSWIEIDFSSWENSSSEKQIFTMIKDSILQEKILKIIYHNSEREATERIVKPLKLIYKSSSWYLFGYCYLRKANRYFKVRRIEKIDIFEKNMTEYQNDVENILSYKKEKYENDELLEVSLIIDKSMAFRVLDEFRNGEIIKLEHEYIVKTQLPDAPWVIQYLLGYGDTLQVLEPVSVREKMRAQIKNMLSFLET